MVNVGSPDAPTTPAVRQYLREFLSDARVLDFNALKRWLLVNLVILPTRPQKSAEAYRAIWREDGSPLVHFSKLQQQALEKRLGRPVVLAFGYGQPSLPSAVAQLNGAARVTVVPMFPHYASATVGSVLEGVYRTFSAKTVVPALRVVAPFWKAAGFLDAMADNIKASRGEADHVLLSYHGLPERQVMAADEGCLRSESCCDRVPAGCYRAQCLATSRELAARLPGVALSSSFQSRLGRDKWLGPSTEAAVEELAKKGIKRLTVACPSFVADCLETLEEIGLRAKETFVAHGGEHFTLVPCVNDSAKFIEALAQQIESPLPL